MCTCNDRIQKQKKKSKKNVGTEIAILLEKPTYHDKLSQELEIPGRESCQTDLIAQLSQSICPQVVQALADVKR
jgi:hypothetical protein